MHQAKQNPINHQHEERMHIMNSVLAVTTFYWSKLIMKKDMNCTEFCCTLSQICWSFLFWG